MRRNKNCVILKVAKHDKSGVDSLRFFYKNMQEGPKMNRTIREELEQYEQDYLSPYASKDVYKRQHRTYWEITETISFFVRTSSITSSG